MTLPRPTATPRIRSPRHSGQRVRRTSSLLLALVAIAFVAACTVSEAGDATSGATTDASTGSSSPSSDDVSPSSVEVPPPPRDLSLDGIDPCALFSESQRADLQIDQVTPDDGSDAGTIYKDMKACSLDKDAGEPFITYDVVAVTNIDVSWWINKPHNADVKLISIGGYPAAEFHLLGGGKHECAVAVGVAKNQHLHVEMAPISDGITGDAICQGSKEAAEMALQTLQSMR
ncbi:DUF3558 domain-containing protein [Actinophytocola sp.]|uniref:DUF3558 domain-containing protein n=1 Tax=Actinophytocola sp. TaxID=1872138 RepID=UPI00389A2B1F